MFIQTASGTLDKVHASKDNKEKGTMALVKADRSVDFDGNLKQIKGRGNSTWGFAKNHIISNWKIRQICLEWAREKAGVCLLIMRIVLFFEIGSCTIWQKRPGFHSPWTAETSIFISMAITWDLILSQKKSKSEKRESTLRIWKRPQVRQMIMQIWKHMSRKEQMIIKQAHRNG